MLVEHADDADIDPPLRRQPFEGRYAVLAALVTARRCMMVDSMAELEAVLPYDSGGRRLLLLDLDQITKDFGSA